MTKEKKSYRCHNDNSNAKINLHVVAFRSALNVFINGILYLLTNESATQSIIGFFRMSNKQNYIKNEISDFNALIKLNVFAPENARII